MASAIRTACTRLFASLPGWPWALAAAGIAALWTAFPDTATRTARFALESLIQMAPTIMLAVILAAGLRASGADALVSRAFEGRSAVAIITAALIGALTPICGVGVLPLIAGLLRAGVPLAPIIAFWLASPVTDPAMLTITAGTLGLQFAIGKTVIAFAIGLVGGTLTAALSIAGGLRKPLRSGGLAAETRAVALPGGRLVPGFWRDEPRRALFLREARSTAVLMLKWLTIAFVLEGILRQHLPAELVAQLAGRQSEWAIPLAVLIGTPIYLDGYAALPLVRGLIDMGMTPGAAMAFLVAGGITSLYASVAVYALVRLPVFAWYLLLAIVLSLASGYVYQALPDPGAQHRPAPAADAQKEAVARPRAGVPGHAAVLAAVVPICRLMEYPPTGSSESRSRRQRLEDELERRTERKRTMRITAIETIRLDEFPNLLWLHVHTDEGLKGLGETFFGPKAVEAYIHETAAPRLLGEDPLAIERHSRTLLNNYLGFSGSGAEMRGASAIDIALWDLFGKATGQPIWQLLGGLFRDKVRTYNTCAGYRYVRGSRGQLTENWGLGDAEGPYEDLDAFLNRAGELAQSLLEQGITGMKIWPFDPAAERWHGLYIAPDELDQALEPFRKIRDAVGARMDIMVEFHSLWNLTTARRLFAALEEFEPFWFEDPIKMNNMDALSELQASTRVPVCASETVATRFAFRDMIERHACGIVMLDLSWVGGLSEAKKIATMAETHHLPVAPHDCTGPVVLIASCHLSLNAPNALVQESVRAFYTGWYQELVTDLPRIEGGFIYPMTRPGLGTELLPEVMTRGDATIRRSSLG